MSVNEAYYLSKMKEAFSLKQRKNPQYSLRSYARDLSLHPSTLSQILKKNRMLPVKNSYAVIEKLGLSPKEKTLFLESLYLLKTKLDDIKINLSDERFMLDESHYRIIAEWEHYAILTLLELKKFKPTISEISKKLGISENRTEVVVGNLMTSKLISKDKNGSLVKTKVSVRTTEDITSKALIESHKESLELGKQKLEEIDLMFRDFSSLTIGIDMKKMNDAKTIIREFRLKMSALLKGGDKTEVYHLAIQFYPMTQLQKVRIQK